jgi:hypothetical protein
MISVIRRVNLWAKAIREGPIRLVTKDIALVLLQPSIVHAASE